MELCAVCHGVEGKGDGPAAAELKEPMPDLTKLAAANNGVSGETRVVSHGTLDMPIWGRAFADARPDVKPVRRQALAKQRIYNLAVYLESLQAE